MTLETTVYGKPDADTILIQMVDDHDLEGIENEAAEIRKRTGGKDFCLKAVKVRNWNSDLSPWPAPAIFGKEDFGDGAAETLRILMEEVLPDQTDMMRHPGKHIYIGGYSLAGLFALWAGYQTDRFDGIAAASPSVWFPHFTEYMRENKIRAGCVYLSLGNREEKTRNPVMARVGMAIRDADIVLRQSGTDCILEWNQGNHFKNADIRTAKAFSWLIGRAG